MADVALGPPRHDQLSGSPSSDDRVHPTTICILLDPHLLHPQRQ